MNKKSIFLLSVIGLLSCSNKEKFPENEAIPLNKQDSLAIVDIYNKTGGGTKWAYSWNLHDIKTWYTVTLREIKGEYRVVGFQLADINPGRPSGYIPESICSLTELEDLSISSEKIYGKLPESISKLTKLRNLTIKTTNLTILPPEVGELQQLERLYLFFNSFEGNLPKELGNLPSNTKIWIQNNKFSGTVPLEILKNRSDIILDHNNFTELPWECWLNDEYTIPSILYNKLSGTVPDEVLNCEKWNLFKDKIFPQQKGYGYIVK